MLLLGVSRGRSVRILCTEDLQVAILHCILQNVKALQIEKERSFLITFNYNMTCVAIVYSICSTTPVGAAGSDVGLAHYLNIRCLGEESL